MSYNQLLLPFRFDWNLLVRLVIYKNELYMESAIVPVFKLYILVYCLFQNWNLFGTTNEVSKFGAILHNSSFNGYNFWVIDLYNESISYAAFVLRAFCNRMSQPGDGRDILARTSVAQVLICIKTVYKCTY